MQVTLYGEARCPFCADWLVKNSQKLVAEIGKIIEFRLVEFGNARRNETTGELQCQHGPSECEANALFACTREAFSSNGKKGKGAAGEGAGAAGAGAGGGRGRDAPPYRWLNVVTCSERDVFEHAADPLEAFDACVVAEVKRGGSPFSSDDGGDGREDEGEEEEILGSSSSSDDDDDDGEKAGRAAAARLRACASGDGGAALIAEAEKETNSLFPKHTFVPWVVVDGLPLGDASLEVARSVACAAWRGRREERPEACLAAPGLGGGREQQQPRSTF